MKMILLALQYKKLWTIFFVIEINRTLITESKAEGISHF